MESTTYIKYLKTSPKKLRFIAAGLRKMSPKIALSHLSYAPQQNSQFLYKSIQSAIASAKTKLNVDDAALKFKTLAIEQGPSLKRFRPGARGMARSFVRRASHIKIVLVADSASESTVKTKEKAVKKTAKKNGTKS